MNIRHPDSGVIDEPIAIVCHPCSPGPRFKV
jgi:hypothetical protein